MQKVISSDTSTFEVAMTREGAAHFGANMSQSMAEIDQPNGEIHQLREELNRLLARQRVIMELLGTTNPDRILHDIRNVLNERQLLRALAELEEE